jgi:hypothetical protein
MYGASTPLDQSIVLLELNRCCRLCGAHTAEEGDDSSELYFNTGDVIGCGFNDITSEVFYTKNGLFLGAFPCAHYYAVDRNCFRVLTDALLWLLSGVGHTEVSIQPSEPLYAVVSLAGPQEKVWTNFGQAPFLWDFQYHQVLHARPPHSIRRRP